MFQKGQCLPIETSSMLHVNTFGYIMCFLKADNYVITVFEVLPSIEFDQHYHAYKIMSASFGVTPPRNHGGLFR